MGYGFKELLSRLGGGAYFESDLEIPTTAGDFIKAHQDVFPAPSQAAANAVTNPVDPRLVSQDCGPYTATLVKVYGSVIKTEKIPNGAGQMTMLQVSPEAGGNTWFVFYPGETAVLDQDYGNFWVLPIGLVQYQTVMNATNTAVVSFGSWIEKASSPWGF